MRCTYLGSLWPIADPHDSNPAPNFPYRGGGSACLSPSLFPKRWFATLERIAIVRVFPFKKCLEGAREWTDRRVPWAPTALTNTITVMSGWYIHRRWLVRYCWNIKNRTLDWKRYNWFANRTAGIRVVVSKVSVQFGDRGETKQGCTRTLIEYPAPPWHTVLWAGVDYIFWGVAHALAEFFVAPHCTNHRRATHLF